jgi:hypothetical protein
VRRLHADDIDEPARFGNLAFYPGPGAYYFEQDAHGQVVILDGTGTVVERYTYAAFGAPQFETPANVRKVDPRLRLRPPAPLPGAQARVVLRGAVLLPRAVHRQHEWDVSAAGSAWHLGRLD